MFFFLDFFLICLKGLIREGETRSSSMTSHDGSSGQAKARGSAPRAALSRRGRARVPGPASAVFPGALAGSWIRVVDSDECSDMGAVSR